ncbi:MAG: ATPase, T2SS/T4P/T4SS family [Pirellulales bacterium]|nr:ATPase, T2SS/T4P/T4SS family [Pirellulales bacterium]
MRRFLLLCLLVAVVCCLACPELALAQPTPAPTIKPPPEGWPPSSVLPFRREPAGFYFSLVKILVYWLTFLMWVKLTDYLCQDTVVFKQNHSLWNPILVGTGFLGLALFWVIPYFLFAYLWLLLALFVAPVVYVILRNATLPKHEKIFTPQHLRAMYADYAGKFGVKVKKEADLPQEEGAPVKFIPKGADDDQKNQVNLITARQSAGWQPAKQLIADMLARKAEMSMLEYSAQGVAVRFSIDGCWHNVPALTREVGDPMLAALKKMGNANEQDRRGKQEAIYECEYEKIKYQVRLVTQGTETGERAILSLKNTKTLLKSLDSLGMRAKLIETVKPFLNEQRGIVLVSAPPAGGGYSTIYSVVLRECDRYMRDFVGVEETNHREPEVENVHLTYYDAKHGDNPLKILNDQALKYPNVYAMSDLINGDVARFLIEQCGEDRLVLSGVRAKECAEALLRVLMLKVPAAEFAPEIKLVINMRTVRKLCEKCREAYTPPPETLKKLGLPPSQVTALYRPPTSWPEKEPPCVNCTGIGYVGRTGIFEVLVVGDHTRKALTTTPQLEAVRAAARKDGMRTLQEEGIVLVAKGITSLDELLRVLKGN